MPTVAVKIFVADPYQEFLIADLLDLDFEAFEQEDDRLVAYIAPSRWDDVKREQIQLWLAAHEQPTAIAEEVIQDENWNRQWEETVGPVAIEPFLIKPTWRDVPKEHEDLILLEIDPKMSFGTGYHESTRLMLRLLPAYLKPGVRVLDAGTGTGILAIAAAKLGAAHVDAFDVDEWSQRNALENVYLNEVHDAVRVYAGGMEVLPAAEYDLTLANINLHVIAGLLEDFAARLVKGGHLLASGILNKDRDGMVGNARQSGFDLVEEEMEGEWWGGAFARRRL